MNDEIKKFQVVSNGEVLKGFSILDVADALAILYKITQSAAIDTLICGKPRKVRSARSKAHAESICAKLQVLGLSCGVSEVRPDMPDDVSMHTHMVGSGSSSYDEDYDEDEIEPLSESTDEAMASIDAIYKDATNKVAKNKRIKRIGFFVILLSVLGFGSWFGLNNWLKPKSTAMVTQIELAFDALKSPSAIVYADLAQARKLSNLTSLGGQHFNLQTANLKGAATLLQPLRALKSDVFLQQSDFLSAAVYVNGSAQADWLVVLSGVFDAKHIQEELSSVFNVSKLRDGLYKLNLKRLNDSQKNITSQCGVEGVSGSKQSEALFVSIIDDAVVFSSSSELNFRFQSKLIGLKIKASEPSDKLQQWQTYRERSLISLKAYEREVISQIPIAEQFVQSIFKDNKLDDLSLKLNSDLLSQGVKVELDFVNDKEVALNNVEQSLSTNIDQAKASVPVSFPKVNAFLSSLHIERIDVNLLRLAADLNGELISDINGINADLRNIVNGGVLSVQDSIDILSFKAAEPVWDYAQNASLIEASNKPENSSFEPVYERQGVAIYLDSIGAESAASSSPSLIKLSALRPLSNAIKAWSQSGIQQQLGIYDVLDEKGKSLIQQSQCSNSRVVLNDDNSLQSNAGVQLLPSIKPVDAKILKGWYEIKAPTAVRRVSTSMGAEQSVGWQGGAFRLSRIQGSTVEYRVYGEQQNLLSIRGVNAEGQDLLEHSVKKEGDIVSIIFNGQVASVDLLIVDTWTDEKFDFRLNALEAKPTKNTLAKHQSQDIVAFTRSEKSAFRKRLTSDELLKHFPTTSTEYGRIKTKSAHIILKLEKQNDLPSSLIGDVIVPLNDLLLVSSDAVKIHIELNRKYKAEFNIDFNDAAFTVTGKQYLKGRFSIKLNKLIDTLDTVEGALRFSLPSRLTKRTAAIGNATNSDLQLIGYDYSGDGKSIYLSNKEYDMALLTSQSGKRYLAKKLATKTFEFNSVNQPKLIELFTVKKTNRFSEKFKLKGRN